MNNNVFLRLVEENDKDVLYEWANDPVTRMNAFSTELIPYEEHCNWFRNLLDDTKAIQFLMIEGNEPIGQIRLNVEDNGEAYVSYSIKPDKRGRGYGQIMCKMLLDEVRNSYPYIQKICARVKPTNNASSTCFEKNGFIQVYRQYEYALGQEE